MSGCTGWFLNSDYWSKTLGAYPWIVGQGSKRSPREWLSWDWAFIPVFPCPRWFAESPHWLLEAENLEQAWHVLKGAVHRPGRKI